MKNRTRVDKKIKIIKKNLKTTVKKTNKPYFQQNSNSSIIYQGFTTSNV